MTYRVTIAPTDAPNDDVQGQGPTPALALSEACALLGIDARDFVRALPSDDAIMTGNGRLRAQLAVIH